VCADRVGPASIHIIDGRIVAIDDSARLKGSRSSGHQSARVS
jgi:hypothetical protein